MKWSPAIAGKRGKCKCGATIQVPDEIEPPVEKTEDLLSALERPTSPVVEPNAYANVASAPTLAYARVEPRDQRSVLSGELLREIGVPFGVLILGYSGILIWLAHHGSFVFAAVAGTVMLASLLMFIKTIVLSLFAWALARNSGGSFGHPLGTVLKIAGLVVALDAATLWAISAMVALGAITPRGGFYPIKTFVVLFLSTLVVVALIAQLVYGLNGDEANLFSRFIAGGNLAINALLLIVLVVIAHNMTTAARRAQVAAASAAQTANATPGLVSASSPSSAVVETDADRAIESRLSKHNPFIMEPQDWRASYAFGKADIPLSRLVDRLSIAGASKIYVNTSGHSSGITRIYVDLPQRPEQRDACFAAAADFQASHHPTLLKPLPPTSARFLEIDVRH